MRFWLGRLVLLGALGVMGYFIWRWFFPSPEHVIRQRLGEVARVASISSKEGQLGKLANAQKLASYFTTDAEVSVDVPGRSAQSFSGRDELQQAAIAARSMLSSLKIEFVDVAVTVASDHQTAQAHLTATATLPGEKMPEVQELELGFKRIDRDWLIKRVETVKTLR